MPIDKILVVDDNEMLSKEMAGQLRHRDYDVASAKTLAVAREELTKDTYDLLFLDMRLPDGEGIELLREIQQRTQKPLVVVTTGFSSVKSAVDCMQSGAFDYMTKPYSFEEVDMVLQKAERFTQLVKVSQHLSHDRDAEVEHELLGKSKQIMEVRDFIRKVARTEATVLIHGESGTGKELIARALYNESPRSNAPFIRVNCAAVPENLIESEFFGHEKGSFTGAVNKREGRFELAHGGTLLLDEISETPLPLQAKLLRVLQEREFERIGGSRTIKVDVRVLATTNRNLEESIANNQFRQDLYFRLNVVPIYVPPLRERRDDIAYLAGQFTQRFARKHGARVNGLSPAAMQMLHDHPWPGNVREMQNVIERAIILCSDSEMIEPQHLGLTAPARMPAADTQRKSPLGLVQTAGAIGEFPTLDELERQHILAALARSNNNRTHAARLLNISVRTLRNKINEYNGKLAGVTADVEEDS